MPPLSVLSESFGHLFRLAACNQLHIDVGPVPLAEIEKVWTRGNLQGQAARHDSVAMPSLASAREERQDCYLPHQQRRVRSLQRP
jgi:hypothetical protein